jgi:hypothetical protein
MALNIESANELEAKSQQLKADADLFRKRASEVKVEVKKQQYWWFSKKCMFAGGTVGCVVVGLVLFIVLFKI